MSFLSNWWARTFASLNYRYCMAKAYLLAQQGDMPGVACWQGKALDWQREYLMCGRKMV